MLELHTSDETAFTLAYSEGAAGFDPGTVTPILGGQISTSADGLAKFALDFDLDANSEATGASERGLIKIAGHPFHGGEREILFDLEAVSIDGSPAETSITTYWRFDDGSDGLEYLADVEGEQATVYARWNDDGVGRYDHHVAFTDEDLGPVDEVATACWSDGGAEVFDAYAMFDDSGIYGQLDGSEADCHYGPLDSHPNPGPEFANLPAEGDWASLELLDPPGEGDAPNKRTARRGLRPVRSHRAATSHASPR